MKRIILISGQLCSGKSLLAKNLKKHFGFYHLKTSEIVKKKVDGALNGRTQLQELGTELDKKTDSRWILDSIKEIFEVKTTKKDSFIVVDAVRTRKQIEQIRGYYGLLAVHVHLTGPQEELEKKISRKKALRKGERAGS